MRPQYVLALFIPAAVALDLAHASDTLIFFTTAVALIPAAALMGRATEEAASRAGPGIGGLLNVTFGNAPELIIALFALHKGLHEVTKASIVGSIVGNLLLVLGAATFAGGLRAPRAEGRDYREQRFTLGMAHAQSAMLILAVFALALPAVFELANGHGLPTVGAEHLDFPSKTDHLSMAIAVVLIVIYCAGLLFSLRTHRELFNPFHEEEGGKEEGWTMRRAVLILALAGVVVAFLSEILVGSIEAAAASAGLSDFFMGAIVVAIAGNAAEHWVAVAVAWKQQMDLALNIAIGSAAQVALFVAPVLMLCSFFVGPFAMPLVFNGYELVAMIGATWITSYLVGEGRTNWFEGVKLLAAYAAVVIVFLFA
ncbi:MAG TPA: calcium/proton exchanger [Thermoleophilaceae bacterium]|nr:calcium/proton exchanger [Thermoleophilaceae bacterium]